VAGVIFGTVSLIMHALDQYQRVCETAKAHRTVEESIETIKNGIFI